MKSRLYYAAVILPFLVLACQKSSDKNSGSADGVNSPVIDTGTQNNMDSQSGSTAIQQVEKELQQNQDKKQELENERQRLIDAKLAAEEQALAESNSKRQSVIEQSLGAKLNIGQPDFGKQVAEIPPQERYKILAKYTDERLSFFEAIIARPDVEQIRASIRKKLIDTVMLGKDDMGLTVLLNGQSVLVLNKNDLSDKRKNKLAQIFDRSELSRFDQGLQRTLLAADLVRTQFETQIGKMVYYDKNCNCAVGSLGDFMDNQAKKMARILRSKELTEKIRALNVSRVQLKIVESISNTTSAKDETDANILNLVIGYRYSGNLINNLNIHGHDVSDQKILADLERL